MPETRKPVTNAMVRGRICVRSPGHQSGMHVAKSSIDVSNPVAFILEGRSAASVRIVKNRFFNADTLDLGTCGQCSPTAIISIRRQYRGGMVPPAS